MVLLKFLFYENVSEFFDFATLFFLIPTNFDVVCVKTAGNAFVLSDKKCLLRFL